MANQKDAGGKRFEDAMRELEAIVARIESGDLALEDALAAFEQGITLVRLLNDKLNLAEKQVERLSRDADGALRLQSVADTDEDPMS
ncbi:MAG TPA: exodeoxyribonuclease VII small subunit [Candidatus Kryptonia bacterium]|nr:exodeoxyribonuclease VII small subunit [Candidatus Kryptonia bacterium]